MVEISERVSCTISCAWDLHKIEYANDNCMAWGQYQVNIASAHVIPSVGDSHEVKNEFGSTILIHS